MINLPKTFGIWTGTGWARTPDGHIFFGPLEAMKAQFLDVDKVRSPTWQIRAIGPDGLPLEDIDIGAPATWMQRAQTPEDRFDDALTDWSREIERRKKAEARVAELEAKLTNAVLEWQGICDAQADKYQARIKELKDQLEAAESEQRKKTS